MDDILDIDDFAERKATDFKFAEKGKRIINFIIDYILVIIIQIVFAILLLAIGIDLDIVLQENPLLDYVMSIVTLLIYFIVFEHFTGGKTPGKMITKTRAVTNTNQIMSIKTVCFRSLSRFIPFDPVSFLSSAPEGWHDRLSNTMVVND